MRARLLEAVTVLAFVLASGPIATAHHSFCGALDLNKPFSFSGKVAKIEWNNPHVYLFLDVKNDTGAVQQWVFHVSAPARLSQGGWTKNTLKAGDEVAVRGFLTKMPERRGGLGELAFKGTTLFKGAASEC